MRERVEAIVQTLVRRVAAVRRSGADRGRRIALGRSSSAGRSRATDARSGPARGGVRHLRGRPRVRFGGSLPGAGRRRSRGLGCSSRRVCARWRGPLGRATIGSDRCARRSTGSDFERAFDAIKGHLAAGDTYQVNFTFKMTGEFDGEPRALFADLIEAQRGRHSRIHPHWRLGDLLRLARAVFRARRRCRSERAPDEGHGPARSDGRRRPPAVATSCTNRPSSGPRTS